MLGFVVLNLVARANQVQTITGLEENRLASGCLPEGRRICDLILQLDHRRGGTCGAHIDGIYGGTSQQLPQDLISSVPAHPVALQIACISVGIPVDLFPPKSTGVNLYTTLRKGKCPEKRIGH
jgi:hypothetical protein